MGAQGHPVRRQPQWALVPLSRHAESKSRKECCKTYGFTPNCRRCDMVLRGQGTNAGPGHTEECRARVEEQLRADGDPRMLRADERVESTLAQQLQAQEEGSSSGGSGNVQGANVQSTVNDAQHDVQDVQEPAVMDLPPTNENYEAPEAMENDEGVDEEAVQDPEHLGENMEMALAESGAATAATREEGSDLGLGGRQTLQSVAT